MAKDVSEWLRDVLTAEGHDRRLLLAVDDAHLLDDASRLALARLLGDGTLRGTTLVATTLPADLHSPMGLSALYEVADDAFTLEPVDDEEALRIVREGGVMDASVRVCSALREHTAGLAGHLLWCARALEGGSICAEGALDLSTFVPSDVRRAVLASLSSMPAPAGKVAAAIAALGNAATPVRIGALAGLDAAAVSRGLALLDEGHLLAESTRPKLRSPLLRAAIHGSMRPNERALLARQAAELLHRNDESADDVARHLLRAAPGNDQWVVDVLVTAASQARGVGDLRRASRYLERALRESPGGDRRRQVLVALGRVDALLGRDPAERYLSEALTLTEATDARARLHLDLARVLATHGRHDVAARQLETALLEPGLTRSLHEDLRATHYGIARFVPGLPQRPWEWRGGNQPSARVQRAYDAVLGGEPEESVRAILGDVAADVAQLRDHPNGVNLQHAATILTWLGEPDQAAMLLTEAEEAVGDARITVFTGQTAMQRAVIAFHEGRLQDALELADEAVRILDERWPWQAAVARSWLALIAIELDDLPRAERALDFHLEPGATLAHARFGYARGVLRAAQGELREALEDLETVGRISEEAGLCNPAVIPWRSALATVLRQLGEGHRALDLAAEERRRAEHFGASAPRVAALTALATIQSHEEAVAHLNKALAIAGSDASLETCRARVHLGAALRRTGARKEAIEQLRAAREHAVEMNAGRLRHFAERELLAAGAGTQRTHGVAGPAALTPSEIRVAELVVDGLTNREVAARLFVTTKAVEFHLSNIYTKLAIRSRRELARALSR